MSLNNSINETKNDKNLEDELIDNNVDNKLVKEKNDENKLNEEKKLIEENDKKNDSEVTENASSSSSIDLDKLINNLEISDDNNELTNSLINLIHKRSSVNESFSKKQKEHIKRLNSLDLDGVVEFIKNKKCENIIVMIGAGVSTSAGIPDFRSPGSGLFSKLKKYNLSSPECIFEINFFKNNPKPFFEVTQEIFAPNKYSPTPTHNFIKLLNDKGLLLRLYSQNIDGLETECGLPNEKVIFAHGSFNSSHCLNCDNEYDFEFMKNFLLNNKDGTIPRCNKCNKKPANIIKPDIVFYGESLPSLFFEKQEEDFSQCDLLLVMGTSLAVLPFSNLINKVKTNVPRIYINKEKCHQKAKIDKWLNIHRGFNFSDKNNISDVFLKGESDKIILEIIEKLDWKDEFEMLNKKK